ncbi:MAG: efflux RND transporter periplasmic adaptor subunit [Chitinispirillaceae bacterium]|nr:efflux RND transporter periplasmic adaptor subunit [Chitinispirillaceae bacterium]
MKLRFSGADKAVRITAAVIVLGFVFWTGTLFNGGNSDTKALAAEQGGKEEPTHIWTCSMHPQIRMPKPGKCPLCFMDLIPLTTDKGLDDATGPVRLTMTENAKILAGIATAPAVRRGLTADIRLTGKIALDETRVEMITARVSGRIDRLFVDYTGVPVKKGDHLASIYSPELVSLQKELLVAARAAAASAVRDTAEMVHASISRTFDAAKEKLRLLGFSENDLESVLQRGTTSDHMTIRTGQEGIVLKKLVEEGGYVQTGMPLFHIADLRKLWLLLDAYESDLMWLRLGQKVKFSVEAYPGESFDGSISFIDPVVDPMTRTVKVRVIVGNSDGRLKPDMFVKVRVKASLSKSGAVKNNALRGKWLCPMHPQIVKDKTGTCDICGMRLVQAQELGYVTSGFEDINPLVIPATAPLYTGKRSLVYIAVPDAAQPTYEARTVELGPRVGAYYIVKSGIAEGERVVVNGSFKIDGELQIRARPSMMDPDAGK